MSVAITASRKEQAFLPGYLVSVDDKPSKERYLEKLRMLNGLDPYELPLREWQDDVDKWSETSLIDVTVYLLFSPSPFTQEEIKNYKSLECYQRFIAGWVREILVLDVGDKRVLIAKVRILASYISIS